MVDPSITLQVGDMLRWIDDEEDDDPMHWFILLNRHRAVPEAIPNSEWFDWDVIGNRKGEIRMWVMSEGGIMFYSKMLAQLGDAVG